MKKIISAVLALLIVATCLFGCNNAPGESDTQAKVVQDEKLTSDGNTAEGEKTDANSGVFSEGRLYFPATRPLRKEALLVDSKGSLTWLYAEDESFFEGFDSGDYVRVEHGYIMESYPGQTYVSGIGLIEDGDIYSFTDEEWERLSWVFVEPPER